MYCSLQQLVVMFSVVVTIFMVCWAPYHIYFIYSYHEPNITKIPYISHIYLAFYWLAMSNTCVNPIIYYWMNKYGTNVDEYLLSLYNCKTAGGLEPISTWCSSASRGTCPGRPRPAGPRRTEITRGTRGSRGRGAAPGRGTSPGRACPPSRSGPSGSGSLSPMTCPLCQQPRAPGASPGQPAPWPTPGA